MAWNSFEPGAENESLCYRMVMQTWAEQDGLTCSVKLSPMLIVVSQCPWLAGHVDDIDTRMEQLANKGDGNNFYIDSRAQAHQYLSKISTVQ